MDIEDEGDLMPFTEWMVKRKMSRGTAYRLLHAGELRTFLIGGRRFVSEAADREFIELAREKGAMPPSRDRVYKVS